MQNHTGPCFLDFIDTTLHEPAVKTMICMVCHDRDMSKQYTNNGFHGFHCCQDNLILTLIQNNKCLYCVLTYHDHAAPYKSLFKRIDTPLHEPAVKTLFFMVCHGRDMSKH